MESSEGDRALKRLAKLFLSGEYFVCVTVCVSALTMLSLSIEYQLA